VSWPAEAAERYRLQGYWRGETLGELLHRWRCAYGDRVALVCGPIRWTYAELDDAVDRRAAGLARLGIRSGDRVIVQLPNVAELVVLCFALFRLGALPVLALPAHRSREISYLCAFTEAVGYVIPDVHAGFDYRMLAAAVKTAVPTVEHVLVAGDSAGAAGEFLLLSEVNADPVGLAAPDAGGVALFLLSGGTTGLPKLIPRTHEDYAYNLRASAEVCGLTAQDVYLAALPVAHNFALGCPGALGTLHAGGTVVLAANGSPDEAFALIEQEKVTITALVPPLATLWMDAAEWTEHDLSSLRLLQVGGAKLNAEPARRVWTTLGCGLQQVFGMAEGLLNYTRLDDPENLIVSTQGQPLSPADEIRVVDDDDRDLDVGEVGHLLARGPYTLRGYYRSPEHNAIAFTADGYYRTGDLVRLTPTGHLVVEGRAKDQINRGGDKIAAAELEDQLLSHPNVRDVAAIAVPDEVLGERICAVVVPRGEAPSLSGLTAFLRERGLAAYKLPDRLEIVASLPRTGLGKISKLALVEMLAEERGRSAR
jgi:2,3-dihydroxybenzoate-AMP ligase